MTMNQSGTDSGQSMEDILASIRRIIAEGEQDAKGGSSTPAAPSAEGPKAAPKAETPKTEIFELTQIVQDDGSIVNVGEVAPATPPGAAAADAKLSLVTAEKAVKTEPTAPAPTPVAASKPAATAEAPVVTPPPPLEQPKAPAPAVTTASPTTAPAPPVDAKVESAMAALSRLMDLSKPAPSDARAEDLPERSDSSLTVEDLVRDAVRPLLKQWLDTNLPPLVERMVREAVDKLAKRAG
jgi:uncharacterized protein